MLSEYEQNLIKETEVPGFGILKGKARKWSVMRQPRKHIYTTLLEIQIESHYLNSFLKLSLKFYSLFRYLNKFFLDSLVTFFIKKDIIYTKAVDIIYTKSVITV